MGMLRKILISFMIIFIGAGMIVPVHGVSAQTSTIVILVSDNEADSAVADNIGELLNASVVETAWGAYDPKVSAQIVEKEPDFVIIIGGELAVPAEYEEDISTMGIETIRWAGQNREETSFRAVKGLKEYFPTVFEGIKVLGIIDGRDSVSYGEMKLAEHGIVAFVNYESADFEARVDELINLINPDLVYITLLKQRSPQDEYIFKGGAKVDKIVQKYQSSSVVVSPVSVLISKKDVLGEIDSAENRILEANATFDGLQEPKAKAMLENAMREVEQAREALANGDYATAYLKAITAKGHAEIALKHANELRRGIFQGSVEFALRRQIARLRWMVVGLKNTGADVTEIEQLLDNAENDLKSHRYDEAQKMIDEAKNRIKEIFANRKGREHGHPPKRGKH
ncbi:MAG: YfdX family protein [Palaeococcus sp.]|uniref:YfdX family protein n=1 Tax=Palaeococcus sp. (in: euryarchaeotes) TaxID=2820298 RepID=UPI0025F39666|nr:YfdX family protein [Palaeococcus sp. (in: euryarchaeotes)]MCD6558311.1 YfdX family protein [Palaeococcus sp. (in: euryarchaeotes)]